MPVDPSKRSFSVDEYHKMAEAGIFEHEHVELVEGEVVRMVPKGSLHAACVSRLTRLFAGQVAADVIVRVQDPLPLDDRTELEPDLALVQYRDDYYASAHPSPSDALLVVEVAASSIDYDMHVKLPLYARAGIEEAWLVDLFRARCTYALRPHRAVTRS